MVGKRSRKKGKARTTIWTIVDGSRQLTISKEAVGKGKGRRRGAAREASHPIMLMTMMPLVSHLLSSFPHFLTNMGRVPGPVSRMGGEKERGSRKSL